MVLLMVWQVTHHLLERFVRLQEVLAVVQAGTH
jgi:hypothetical protein